MNRITVIGAGYVGLVTAACFAELGHSVKVIENNEEKLARLSRGIIPFLEQGLPELWNKHRADGNLSLTTNYKEGLEQSEIIFLAVGTPSSDKGDPDLRAIWSAINDIADAVSRNCVLVMRSTAPVGTVEAVSRVLTRRCQYSISVVSNPEFLRESTAVDDFVHPWRVVIGSEDYDARAMVASLYKPLKAPIILCDSRSAEFSKYTSNALLATKVSFINEIASLAECLSVNIKAVTTIVSLDPRCGNGYLSPGLGWGGSCLPKDLRAVLHIAKKNGVHMPLLDSVYNVNFNQPDNLVSKIESAINDLEGKIIGILGLSFKPNTSDIREAPSMRLMQLLKTKGCIIKACDPVSEEAAALMMPEVTYCPDAYEVAKGSDVVVLVTEWEEFKYLDMGIIRSLMKTPVLIDGRNLYDAAEMSKLGFRYEGIGSSYRLPDNIHEVSAIPSEVM